MLFVRGGCSCDVDYMVFIGCAVHSGDCSFFLMLGTWFPALGPVIPGANSVLSIRSGLSAAKAGRLLPACRCIVLSVPSYFEGACFVPVCQKEEYVIMRNRKICPCYR